MVGLIGLPLRLIGGLFGAVRVQRIMYTCTQPLQLTVYGLSCSHTIYSTAKDYIIIPLSVVVMEAHVFELEPTLLVADMQHRYLAPGCREAIFCDCL